MRSERLELAGITVPELMDRLMQNERLVKMIVGKFVEDQTFRQLQAAIAAKDAKAAEFACHSFKGVCGNLALKELFALSQEQLRLFRASEYDQAVAMMAAMEPIYADALVHLNLWLTEV